MLRDPGYAEGYLHQKQLRKRATDEKLREAQIWSVQVKVSSCMLGGWGGASPRTQESDFRS